MCKEMLSTSFLLCILYIINKITKIYIFILVLEG